MFNFYNSVEFMNMASHCTAHNGLHVNADQMILECLGDDERPTEPGEPEGSALTSPFGFTMPLIRYRLRDICTLSEKQCSCGSSFPLVGPPLGRQDDVIRLPSGKVLSPRGLGAILNDSAGIEEYRIIQETLEHVVVQLEFSKNTPAGDLAQLRSQLLQCLGEPVRLDIEIVDFIQEEGPKLKKFISKLTPLDSWDVCTIRSILAGPKRIG